MPIQGLVSVACVALLFGQPTLQPDTKGSEKDAPAPAVVDAASIRSWTNMQLIERLLPAEQGTRFGDVQGYQTDLMVTAEWANRVAAGKFTDQEFAAAFERCGILRTSPISFSGEDLHVWLRPPAWLPEHSIIAYPKGPGMTHVQTRFLPGLRCGNEIIEGAEEERYQSAGVPPAGASWVDFDVEVTRVFSYYSEKSVWKGVVRLPIRQVLRAAPTPVDSPETTALVREHLHPTCLAGRTEFGPAIWFSSVFQRPLSGPLANMYVNLKAELLKDGKVIVTRPLTDPDENDDAWSKLDSAEFLGLHGSGLVPAELADDVHNIVARNDIDRYTVRVRGVAPSTPVRWPREHYWSGEYTVPLKDAM